MKGTRRSFFGRIVAAVGLAKAASAQNEITLVIRPSFDGYTFRWVGYFAGPILPGQKLKVNVCSK